MTSLGRVSLGEERFGHVALSHPGSYRPTIGVTRGRLRQETVTGCAKGRPVQLAQTRRRLGRRDRGEGARIIELEGEVELLETENARLRSALAMARAILAMADPD